LAIDDVTFHSGDSFYPDAPYSGASQTTATVGSAVYMAALEWKRRALITVVQNPASRFHGFSIDGLEIVAGLIRVKLHPEISEPYRTAIQFSQPAIQSTLTFSAQSDAGDQEKYAIQSFGAHFCEVEVDEEIGRATVTRWAATFDCGRVLNPKLARNQVMGGIMFGLGMALLEQVPYDAKTAQLIGEYYLPTHADRPDFDITFVEFPDYLLNPMGARGIGEIGICGVPAAIANAIFHATGKRLRQTPITIEQLMRPFESVLEKTRREQ
jgi:xanthine dehydrogenase YagR molybdenum-binding subunit